MVAGRLSGAAMTPAVPLPIVEALANALRPYPCRRLPNYAGKMPDPPCRHCEALAAFDQFLSIVQTPGVKPGEGEGK